MQSGLICSMRWSQTSWTKKGLQAKTFQESTEIIKSQDLNDPQLSLPGTQDSLSFIEGEEWFSKLWQANLNNITDLQKAAFGNFTYRESWFSRYWQTLDKINIKIYL